MKKFLAVALSAILTLSVMPAYAEDDGVVLVQNETSSSGNYDEFYTNVVIGTAEDTVNVAGMDSALPGVSAIKFTSAGNGTAQWTPKKGKLAENGVYEVFFYNVVGTEKWRGPSTANSIQDRRAKYTIYSANGKTVKIIDQSTASGGQNGWVSLGTYKFKGDGNDRVNLTKQYVENWTSVTYADDVKFVPVNTRSTSLLNVYANLNETDGAYESLNPSAINFDGNRVTVTIPAGQTNAKVILETEDPTAEVTVNGGERTVGGAEIAVDTTAATLQRYTVVVYAEGVERSTYLVSVEVEGTEGNVVTATDAAAALTRHGQFARFVPGIASADKGFYNLYAKWTKIGNNQLQTPYVNVIVDHNGIRDERTVRFDTNDLSSEWVYLGKYYFTGMTATDYNEQVLVMKSTGAGDYLTLNSLKVVPSLDDLNEEAFKGVSLRIGGYVHSISADDIKKGGVLTSGTVGSAIGITVEGTGSLSRELSVKVNGNSVVTGVHQTAWVQADQLVSGENLVEISYETGYEGNDVTHTYKFLFYNTAGTGAKGAEGWQAVESSKRKDGYFYAPISASYARNTNANTKNAAAFLAEANKANPVFKPAFTTETKARVLAWKPVFFEGSGNPFSSTEQVIKITANGEVIEKTVDWQTGNSGWVDLGVYTFSDADDGVEIINDKGQGVLFDDVNFLPVVNGLSGITIDGVSYAENELNDISLVVSDSVVNINPEVVGTTANVTINGEIALVNNNNAVALNGGINEITIGVDGKEYVIYVVSTGDVSAYYDSNVVVDASIQNSAFVGADGVTPAVYISAASESVKFLANGVKGEKDVWVYQVAATGDADAVAEGVIKVATDGEVSKAPVKLNNTVAESGWVKLGTYTFTGQSDDSEYVEICGTAGKNVYVDSVKLCAPADEKYLSASLTLTNGKKVPTVKVYTPQAGDFEVIIASYNGDMTLAGLKKSAKITATGAGIYDVPVEALPALTGASYKAFAWDGVGTLTPLVNAQTIQ